MGKFIAKIKRLKKLYLIFSTKTVYIDGEFRNEKDCSIKIDCMLVDKPETRKILQLGSSKAITFPKTENNDWITKLNSEHEIIARLYYLKKEKEFGIIITSKNCIFNGDDKI